MKIQQLVKGISGIIPGGVSATDFSMMSDNTIDESKKMLEILNENNIGYQDDGIFYFSSSDRLKTALYVLSHGADLDAVSELLHWRDFEGVVAEILESKHFATIRNFILTNPRMEIDVIGIRLGIALLIDCKHWKRQSASALTNTVKKQIVRTRHYVSKTSNSIALPVIVTLHNEQIDFIERVPIVPISQLSSFIDDLYGNLEKVNTIKTDSI